MQAYLEVGRMSGSWTGISILKGVVEFVIGISWLFEASWIFSPTIPEFKGVPSEPL
jgi:hypothetical protein